MNCETTERPKGRYPGPGLLLPRGLAALALLASITPVQVHAQAPWPPAQSNPAARPDDVVLPMPCGGAMVFRRVNIPSADALDDRRVQLGSPEPRFAYAENTRSDYVGGGFADPQVKNQHYYLIGKYEVTALQYDAVASLASGNCPAVADEGRLPKTN